MADTTTEAPATDAPDAITEALVELMRTAVRPDVLEAQRVLLQRLAYQGDVFPSRIPPPRSITEVGGYLNLLQDLGQDEVRAGAVASALGVAGPPPGATGLGGVLPVGFVELANDRPEGPAQASIPPSVDRTGRLPRAAAPGAADIRASGCALPLRAPRPQLPALQAGATATSVDMDAALAALGRTLEVFPGTVLVDPAVDPLVVARLATPATSPIVLTARELDGGTAVPEQSWVAKRASATAVVDDPSASLRLLEVAPIMAAAGWIHPTPVVAPTSLAERGTLVLFVNLTGLVAGETTLGAELGLLYPPAAIARSAFATVAGSVWDGSAFVAPS